MLFFASFESVALLLFMAIPGFIIAKRHMIVKEQAVSFISVILLYVCTPFVTINSFLKQNFDISVVINLVIVFFFVATLIISLAFIGKFIAKMTVKNGTEDERRMISYASAFGNTGYMAIPFLQLLYPGNPLVLLYATAGITAFNIVSWTFGIFVLTGDKTTMNLKRALLNPATLSFICVLPLYVLNINFVRFPLDGLQNTIEFFSTMVGPMAMTLVGIELSDMNFKELFTDYKPYISSLVRLMISPILAFLLILLISTFYDMTPLKVNLITIAAVPSANNIMMFCSRLGKPTKLPAKMVIISTLISIITIPLALTLFT